MKKIISIVLIFCFINTAFADCDWSVGIKLLADGNYEYSKSCHIKVGELVQDDKIKTQQVNDLNQAISLKDLALKDADSRSTGWSETSTQLEERLQKVDSEEKKNELLWLGTGILGTVLIGFMTARLIGR
jgi:anti-sigma factor ChrR (cupin superfamily)